MLKKEFRLRKKYQFNYVYKVGQSVHGKYLLLVYTKSKNKNIKIGISASKKIGGAVIRNRARRLLRAAVSPYLNDLDSNFNLIIVAKQSINGKKMNVVKQDLETALKKAQLL
ncbi:MAG: ribonuclease P protein component [Clostridia bacterium]|nr:ribonuclease P protein component [Clostridia bacterium]